MDAIEQIKQFYFENLSGARQENYFIKAPCPFCKDSEKQTAGVLAVYLNPDSFFCRLF